MSLLTTVPNYPVDPTMPYLLQVRFDAYAACLAGLSGEISAADGKVSKAQAAQQNEPPTRALLTRYVGLNARLTELHTVLASAGVNSMWIRGEPGTGKTTLADEFIRARTEKRLSSSMLGGPFFLLNVSLFLTGPPLGWVDGFSKTLEYVKRNHGLLIIDHIDDLVKASGEASDRMMQALIAGLESSDDVQAIIISDTKNNDSVANAATGILRCFQVMEMGEAGLDSLKPILMSHFRRLSLVHSIDYSEPVADEIIRLLGRYPGRAFVANRRPERAISFADKVGAMVRINVFAEPVELAELRDRMGALRDRMEVTPQAQPVGDAIVAEIETQLASLRTRYQSVNQAYETRFGPYLKARRTLDEIESQLGPIEARPQQDRSAEQRRDFNTLKDGLPLARESVARETHALHQVRPEVTKADVRKVFSDDSGVPLSNLSANKLDRLRGLEIDLGSEIFGQDAPVKAVAKVWRERELGVSDPSRPAGVLLFTGGTGLGKTELTRVLARWDGGAAAMPAVLRMSEFKDKSAISRLTGAAPGLIGFDEGAPTMEECEDKDIVVFDEIDKADPNIYDVMMQILEEGEITLSNGKKISFKGKLMVITTNAVTSGDLTAEEIDRQDEHQEVIRTVLCEAKSKETGLSLFRPEFIGRVDEVYVYKALDHDTAIKILKKELAKINRDYQERGISVEADDLVLRPIIDKHYVPSQGGRSPRQIVKKRVRPLVTDYLMARLLERQGDDTPLNDKVRLEFDLPTDTFSLARIVQDGPPQNE
jgi:ATP-dependent Clp protease ATP-binding subunit ClpB